MQGALSVMTGIVFFCIHILIFILCSFNSVAEQSGEHWKKY